MKPIDWVAKWQVTRAPEIADAIENGIAGDGGIVEALAKASKGKSVEHFIAAAKKVKALDDDPRITTTILGWLRDARASGSSAGKAWTSLFEKLVELRDLRAVAPLREMVAKPPRFQGAAHTKKIVAQIAATADAIAKTKPKKLSAADGKALAARPKKAAPAKAGDPLALVQQVFDAPDDDALRQVVADQLIEQGHPWGEFINLQFAGASPAREQELIKQIGSVVCGPIAAVTNLDDREFARGFLVGCNPGALMKSRRDWEDAAAAPHWATVRRVNISHEAPKWWLTAFLGNPATRHLREISLCRYTEPKFTFSRAMPTSPWTLTGNVTKEGTGWLRMLTAFVKGMPPTDRAAIQLGKMTAAAEVRAALAAAAT